MNELDNKYQTFIDILNEELVPAMGCTEPIAIAFCAAKVKEVLGYNPSEVNIFVSGNILKNVKSVIVPHTHGRHGIEVAAAIGILAGDSNKKLEVLSNVKEEDIDIYQNQLYDTTYSLTNNDD